MQVANFVIIALCLDSLNDISCRNTGNFRAVEDPHELIYTKALLIFRSSSLNQLDESLLADMCLYEVPKLDASLLSASQIKL